MSPLTRIMESAAAILLVLGVSGIVVAENTTEAETLKRTLRHEEIRRQGTELLKQARWHEAGEMFGTVPIGESLGIAWDWSEGMEPDRRDRYRFALVNFHVRYSRQLGWPRSSHVRQKQFRAEYRAIVTRGDYPPDDILDFSHLDLLDATAIPRRSESEKALEASRERIYEILEEKPESIPAMTCLLRLLPGTYLAEREDEWRTATKLLTGPIGKLALARHIRPNGSGTGIEWCERVIGQSWQLAPTDSEKAALLLKSAEWWHARLPRRDIPDEMARETYNRARKVYETFPATVSAAQARTLAVEIVCDARSPDRAMQLIRDLRRYDKHHTDGLDRAMVTEVAPHYFDKKRYDLSEAILLEVVEKEPAAWLDAYASLKLSEIYNRLGKQELEIKWLTRSAGVELNELPDGPISIHVVDATQEAILRLARIYERRGQWQKSLAYWQAWDGRGYEGNESPHPNIATCKIGLGQFDEAAEVLLKLVFERNIGYFPRRSTAILCKLYHDARQVDDLLNMLEEFRKVVEEYVAKSRRKQSVDTERPRDSEPMWIEEHFEYLEKVIHQATLYHRLAEERKIDSLIEHCRKETILTPNYWGYAADKEILLRATADCGDLVIDRAARMTSMSKRTMPTWLIHVLGRHRSEEALTLLLEEAFSHSLGNDHITYAIAQHGTEAVEQYERLINRVASGGTREQRTERARLTEEIDRLERELELPAHRPSDRDALHPKIDELKAKLKELDRIIITCGKSARERLPKMKTIASRVPTHDPLPRPEPGSLPTSLTRK